MTLATCWRGVLAVLGIALVLAACATSTGSSVQQAYPPPPTLPFLDNPNPAECGIPVVWTSDEPVQVTGYYEGELIQPEVYLYESHLRKQVVGAVATGTMVQIKLFQANPELDYYFVKTTDGATAQEGWTPGPFLELN